MPLRARSWSRCRRSSGLTPKRPCSRSVLPSKGPSLRKLLTLVAFIAAFSALPAMAATKTTSLKDDYFTKGKLTVEKGTTVVWKWETDDDHTVTEIHGRWGSKQTDHGSFKHKFK